MLFVVDSMISHVTFFPPGAWSGRRLSRLQITVCDVYVPGYQSGQQQGCEYIGIEDQGADDIITLRGRHDPALSGSKAWERDARIEDMWTSLDHMIGLGRC
jgi:hypothetical protein